MKATKRFQWAICAVSLAVLIGATVSAQAEGQVLQVNVGEAVTVPIQSIAKLAVADPAIADVAPLTENEISIIGKKVGVTTLTVVHTEGKPTEMYRVEVGNDTVISTIRKAISPSSISVRVIGDTLVLEGQVETELESQRAEQLAKAFKPQVANMLEVKSPRQIKIRVRVAEVSSDATRKIGMKWLGADGSMRYAFDLNPIDKLFDKKANGFVGYTVGNGDWNSIGSSWSADVILQLLEQKGWARLLSEPTLITRSGTEASFLVGEEVPIIQTLANVSSVTFKEVGVRMMIKPVADSQNRINTTIHAEVSAVTDRNVVGSGVALPIIASRKADTTLQLNDGQTIVIGGLLDNNISKDTLRKFPWLADIPVIGALFRHKDRSHTQRELVFFMTPSIVKNVEVETADAARTPVLKDWVGEKAQEGVLGMPKKNEDWGLHEPGDWGIPESWKKAPGTEEPVTTEPAKEPMTNYTPARPAAK